MRWTRAAALLAVVALALTACGGDSGPVEDATSEGPDRGVLLSEVSDHPEPITGHRASISGIVRDQLSDRALLLGEEGGGSDDRVLVVAERPLSRLTEEPVVTGAALRATGAVRSPDAVDFSEFGIGSDELGDYSGGVVMARSLVADPTFHGPGDTEEIDESALADRRVTVTEVLQNTDDLIGRRVTVSAEIESVRSDHAFVIGDGRLLVLHAGGAEGQPPFVEAGAVVTGTVQRVREQTLSQSVQFDLDEEILEAFDEQPVIIAGNVQIIA